MKHVQFSAVSDSGPLDRFFAGLASTSARDKCAVTGRLSPNLTDVHNPSEYFVPVTFLHFGEDGMGGIDGCTWMSSSRSRHMVKCLAFPKLLRVASHDERLGSCIEGGETEVVEEVAPS